MSTLDTTFGSPNGYVRTFVTDFGRVDTTTMAILSDGNILVGGTLSDSGGNSNNFYLAKYDPVGNLVPSFANAGIFYIQIPNLRCFGRSLAIQSDGKILFCGRNFDLDSIVVMRLLSDGSFDTATFGSGNGYVTTPVTYFNTTTDTYNIAEPQSILVQSDGKIVVSGYVYYNASANYSVYALVRYNPDGTYDGTFGNNGAIAHHINTLCYEFANSMVIQSGGKIVVGGGSDFGTDRHFSAARFNSDGSVDTTFGPNNNGSIILPHFSTSPVNSYDEARTIKIQTDGKLVLSGYSYDFINPDYYYYIGITRLSSNGIVDGSYGTNGYVRTSPNPPSFRAIVTSMVLQPNNKVIICGWYGSGSGFSTTSTILLARYNIDGTLDPLFGVNNDGYITTQLISPPESALSGAVSLQTDGKIVVAGYTRILTDSPGIYSILVARYLYFADPDPDPVIPVVPICFVAGSEVLTDQGHVPIEKINPSIHTICRNKIVALTKTRTNETNIVCVEKNAFRNNIPNTRTLMSGEHGIFTKNKLIPVKEFVSKKSGVYFVKYNDEILYNILLDRHSIMNVNNMIVETLDPRNIVSKLYINNYSAKEKSEIVSKVTDILNKRATDNKFYLLNSKSTNPITDTNNNDYTFKNFKKSIS